MLEARLPHMSTMWALGWPCRVSQGWPWLAQSHSWIPCTLSSPPVLFVSCFGSSCSGDFISAGEILNLRGLYECAFGTRRRDWGPGYPKSTQKCCLQQHLRGLQTDVKYCPVNCSEEKLREGNLSLFVGLIYNVGQISQSLSLSLSSYIYPTYMKFYSPEEMWWRVFFKKCFEPYFLSDRKRGRKKENHQGSQFISMDLFLNAWFRKKWMRTPNSDKQTNLLCGIFSGCVRLSVGTLIVYLHQRASQVIVNFCLSLLNSLQICTKHNSD